MAKAPAKPEEGAKEAAPKKSGKLLLIIVIVLLLVLILAAGGVALLLLLKNKGGGGGDSHAEAPPAAAAPAGPAKIDLAKPPSFVTLDPFTVNLRSDEGDRYLQTVVVLRVSDEKLAESLKGFMPEIRHRINLLLSNRLPSEVATVQGREELASDILDQANEALGFPPPRETSSRRAPPTGPVQAVLFNSFIIQ
ncbi:flagellar basal body protein FliL [Azoarcus indigens]|uniref:Flagellar protein FliL n=1 Tax=Azoarcus indigens TaxID=29545 RepID=A0A4R6DT98_9RHOO|nr:flagellar basal body-associated FliL family protein [Azoarcus indigens]NMG64432.1 flagellar basal body protein FliL [Azoarcus indigens]TDN48370.1 flagellar FliL protein [Azoarcus indigens]